MNATHMTYSLNIITHLIKSISYIITVYIAACHICESLTHNNAIGKSNIIDF